MNKILAHIKKLFLEILPAFIFFLIMFHILMVTKALTLKQYGITTPSSATAVIGALVVAKVMLVANRLPFLNLYPRKPLIWNVLLKWIVFSLLILVFIIPEYLVHMSRKYGGFAAARSHFYSDIIWTAFWLRQLWINLLILFYCSAAELARAIGGARVKEIFFGIAKR